LSHLHAYQADPPYDAHAGGQPKAGTIVHLEGEYLVDLAEGGEDAPPLLVGQVDTAPVGHYNAISWEMVQAAEGPAEGYTLVLIGKAEKEGQGVPFTIRIDKEYEYTCGDYVGDERKGFLEADGMTGLEMTFHFDHIFGDAEAPMDDDLNQLAVGFDPFAALAQGGTLDVNMAQLEAQLSAQAYQMLEEILPTLGHVGEGHCHSEVR
jgi:hypothetical protein